VTEVCYAVGFSSLGSFSSRFTELVGVSPSEYRVRDHRSAAEIPPCTVMLRTRPVRRPRTGYLYD
jgi:AraC-like DNA-binding protein